MTDEEWSSCTDPHALLESGRDALSPRRYRLVAAGCASLVSPYVSYTACRRAVEVALRRADRKADRNEVREARERVSEHLRDPTVFDQFKYPVNAHHDLLLPVAREALNAVARWVRLACGTATEKYRTHMLRVVRDVVGHPVKPHIESSWLTDAVLGLARGVYEERAYGRLPVLVDAIEDAGCSAPELLAHLRGPGPHYPGCWALDLLVGRS